MSAAGFQPDSQIEFRRRDTEIAVAAFRTVFLLVVMFSSQFADASGARGNLLTIIIILAAAYNLGLFVMHARGVRVARWFIVVVDLGLVTLWVFLCGAGCTHFYILYYPVVIVAGLWFGVAGALVCALLACTLYVWALIGTGMAGDVSSSVVLVQVVVLIVTAGVVSITAEIQARERRALEASRGALQRLSTRIRIARNVDELVRPQRLPSAAGLDVAFRFRPAARAAAGDYYDLVFLGDRRWGVCVADIRGNRELTVAYLPVFKAALRVAARREQYPALVLAEANRQVAAEIADRREWDAFVSMCYVMIDLDEGSLSYAIAGNEPPVLLRADGQQVLSLAEAGIVLGVLPDAAYEEEIMPLQTGDVVVLFTDGMTEVTDRENRFLDREGLIARILENASAPTADAMANGVFDYVNAYGREGLRRDDMTLMVVRVTATDVGLRTRPAA